MGSVSQGATPWITWEENSKRYHLKMAYISMVSIVFGNASCRTALFPPATSMPRLRKQRKKTLLGSDGQNPCSIFLKENC